jgi:hypothetical protein
MRYAVIGIIIVIFVSATAPACAHTRPLLGGTVSVEIVSDNGSPFHSILLEDFRTGKTRVIKEYLEAKKGENYGIVIRNNLPERIGVVVAADGRNIISGNRSDLKNNDSMYLVNAYETARYNGWRTSDSEVHRFYFTEPADSYSMRTFADSSAMGVIAVAVFREKERPQPLLKQKRCESAPARPSLEDGQRSQGKALDEESAGTGFGEAQYSPAVRVEFEPERVPIQKTLVKYEWRDTLCRKGILQCGKERKNRLWDREAFAPYPPDYQRN